MLLTETYKNRLKELAGIKPVSVITILKEAVDLYANSSKRVKFDMNIMKQAIEGGMEVGMIFQSNNSKYKMPIWKTRIVQPVAMGYDKKGELVIRGIHVEGQSEKKAIETGIRSAQAKNEWRLFKASNIKSMFFTGGLFSNISLPGYNPNDSAMSEVIVSFNPKTAIEHQKQISAVKQTQATSIVKPAVKPITRPVVKPVTKPVSDKPVQKAPSNLSIKDKENAKELKNKIDKLNKLL